MAANADRKINKHDIMEVFLTDIYRKNHVYQRCVSYATTVRKNVGNAFSVDMETWISKSFPSVSTMGYLMEKLN